MTVRNMVLLTLSVIGSGAALGGFAHFLTGRAVETVLMIPQTSERDVDATSTLASLQRVSPRGTVPFVRTTSPILPNDNRRPAGRLEGGILTLRLVADEGLWQPLGAERPGIRIGAFAEEGGPLQIPGPLVRVPVGTEVHSTVRNALPRPLTLVGLGEQRGFSGDTVVVAPDEVVSFRFIASEPGTYYYSGWSDRELIAPWGASLHGAIVVDPPGAVVRPGDRVFVISNWFPIDTATVSGLSDEAVITANGLAWPHTELVEAMQGDSLEWRWINMTSQFHPMHLHGFHFRVDAKGDGARDTIFTPEQRWLAVTEWVGPGTTVTTSWSPDRPGNWIFHCHILSHMTPIEIVNAPLSARGDAHGHGAENHMGKLVVGIRVSRSEPAIEDAREPRPLRLLVRSRPGVYGEAPGYAYVLGGSPEESDPDALIAPGPTLVLERDQPVAITIVNHSHEPAAVHWHGIELESFPDGIPGWSGEGDRILPAIDVGDSITVRFTPPRAGTFMYHSHFNEMQQIGSGLYGAILVLEPGQQHDPETDRVLLFSHGGPWISFGPRAATQPGPPLLLNGSVRPEPLHMHAGTTYRLRVINITGETDVRVRVLSEDGAVSWRAVAKDGADLPPARATLRPVRLSTYPGEIYDFEFTPEAPGDLVLEYDMGPWDTPKRVPVRVR